MTKFQDNQTEHPLARHRGLATLSAPEIVAKAVLECLPSVSMLSLTDCPRLRGLIQLLQRPDLRDLCRMHRLQVVISPDATRAFELATWATKKDRHVLAMLAGPTTQSAIPSICAFDTLQRHRGAALGCIVEDTMASDGVDHPGLSLVRSAVPVIEASTVEHLRICVENTLRLSRADHTPAVTLVHPTILECGATIRLRSNRSDEEPEDVGLRQRQRGPRWTESGGGLRMARRLELNTHHAMPSPGDPSPIGFITVGPADPALRHVLSTLGMSGRVPILHLGLLQPIDDAAVKRLLSRCQNVIVLEPHPGVLEEQILSCAERMRDDTATLASIWGRRLPHLPDGSEADENTSGTLHPSVLARRILHLLRILNPEATRSTLLDLEPPDLPLDIESHEPTLGPQAQDRQVRGFAQQLFDSVTEDGAWLGTPEDDVDDEDSTSSEHESIRIMYDGVETGPSDGRRIRLETWSHDRFERFGPTAIRQAVSSQTNYLFLISQYPGSGRQDMERLARSAVPAGHAEQVTVRRANLSDPDRVLQFVREIVLGSGHGIIVLDDGPPARFDVDSIETALDEIDQLGYQMMQRLIWPAERACVIRQPPLQAESEALAAQHAMPAETTWAIDPIALRWPPRIGGRIRPLVEQVEVFRSQAPIRRQPLVGSGIPTPTPRHADRSNWCVHLAGLRGSSPGLAVRFLVAAGDEMQYRIRYRSQSDPIGAGRRAWAQVLFTKVEDDRWNDGLSSTIPFGEADLLLGFDRSETLRSLGPGRDLRIGSSERTCGVVNLGLFEDQLDLGLAQQDTQTIEAYLSFRLAVDGRFFDNFSDICRYRFHNERMADVVQIGTAFQLGWIPTTVDAMIAAATFLESLGFARTLEGFEFGRRLAINAETLRRPGDDGIEEDSNRIVRRFGHALRRTGPGRLARTARFRRLVQRTLVAMPGLNETRAGREARRDLVIALRRCLVWRSFEEAERLSDDIAALYLSDRADRGRQLTRLAVLPLAESTLIRDAIYMASMAVSPEHRRRTRQRLNVKRGRGDRIESRYVTRIELVLFKWRFRVDMRTSDWATRVLAFMRRLLPRSWRGTRRERDIRTVVRDLVLRATMEGDRYDHWVGVFQELHDMALDGRLRRISASALKEVGRGYSMNEKDHSAPETELGPADW